jgi:hypothetical protein
MVLILSLYIFKMVLVLSFCYRNLSCDDELPWKEGSTLFNFINGVEMNGLTGPIRYEDGYECRLFVKF